MRRDTEATASEGPSAQAEPEVLIAIKYSGAMTAEGGPLPEYIRNGNLARKRSKHPQDPEHPDNDPLLRATTDAFISKAGEYLRKNKRNLSFQPCYSADEEFVRIDTTIWIGMPGALEKTTAGLTQGPLERWIRECPELGVQQQQPAWPAPWNQQNMVPTLSNPYLPGFGPELSLPSSMQPKKRRKVERDSRSGTAPFISSPLRSGSARDFRHPQVQRLPDRRYHGRARARGGRASSAPLHVRSDMPRAPGPEAEEPLGPPPAYSPTPQKQSRRRETAGPASGSVSLFDPMEFLNLPEEEA
ncbi:hypothetical protein F4780DRAFT_785014 [Xylariomycetidae sp. FL0641]|nr:hypothetical protein F4780DRAFT_785014 [Xylariomycetidae sp. FL0641]